MKKIFLLFTFIGVVLLLTSFRFNTNNDRNDVEVVVRTIEGHRYIITTNYGTISGIPGGVAIIHAESCKCIKH